MKNPFIELTKTDSKNKVLVNVSLITRVFAGDKCTHIKFDNENSLAVIEDYETVKKMINDKF